MIMKKIFSFILLLAGVTMVTSCGEDDATYTPVEPLEIVSNNVLFETAGGTGTITVKGSEALTASTAAQWLAVSVSGNTVTVTAQENPSLSGRSAQITLTAGGKTAKVTATQKGLAYGVTEGLNYEVDDMENVLEMNFSNSLPGTVTSLDEWIAATLEGTSLTLKVAENFDKKARSGKVVVKSSEYSDTITVLQRPMVFEVTESQLDGKDNKAQNFDVKILHSKKVSLSRDVDWIGAKWKNDSVLTVSIAANKEGLLRSGHLFVKSGNETEPIFIAQYNFLQEVASDYYTFWYFDAKANDWNGILAVLNLEEQVMSLYPDENTMYSIPVALDQENNVLLAGPSTTFVSTYGPYFLYWVWMTASGSWSGVDKLYSVGEFVVEEDEEGNVYSSIYWGGQMDEENDIDAWAIMAATSEGLTEDNVAGYLVRYYFPQMEKYAAEPDGVRGKTAVKPSKSHKPLRAKGVKNLQNPKNLQYVLR